MSKSGWQRVLLGSLIDTQKGYAFKSSWYCDTGRRIVKVSNFTEDSIDSSGLTCITESTAAEYLRYQLHVGDVIVQTVGSWPNNPASVVGKCVRTPSEIAGSLLNQNAVKLAPSTHLEKQFLFYLLRGGDFKTYIIGTAQGAASQAAITLEAIRDYEFELPPLPVQQRIAGILSAYDELIEISQRRIQILETTARSLFREWFVEYRFPGYEKQTRVSSTFGQIPNGWEVRKVSEFADFERGVEPGSNAYVNQIKAGFVKFLRVGDFSKRSGNLFVSEHLTKGKRLNPQDIAVTLDGSVGLVRIGLSGAYSTGIRKIIVQNKARLGWSFAYNLMLSGHIQATIEAHATGATIKHAGTAVAALEFVSPPEQLLNEFEKITSPMLMQILNLNDQLNNLYQTRDLLLPRLLSGQIDLSNQLEPMPT